jgi:hypothetical protein
MGAPMRAAVLGRPFGSQLGNWRCKRLMETPMQVASYQGRRGAIYIYVD